ncbi:MAG: phosphate ABC transporter substrate-binding protein PstS, partial [Gemmatimonadales bacterium]
VWRIRYLPVTIVREASRCLQPVFWYPMRSTFAALLFFALAGCSSETVFLTGAGATFPNIIYQRWMIDYNGLHPNVQMNYQSIGSGGGIRQFSDGTVDFGGSDAPMNDSAIAALDNNVLHIPTVLGADVLVYNLPEVTTTLRFTQDVVADMFLGRITRWNDARIRAINPGVTLPDRPIIIVYRSDGSGTTYIWTDYLSKISSEWAERVGRGTSVSWPVGIGGRGNEGVAGTVRQTPGAAGYVELGYALINNMPAGILRNRAGNFIEPTIPSVTAAAAGAMATMGPDTDFRVSITDPEGADAYPVASFTWLLMHREYADQPKARALIDFVWWALTDGQAVGPELGYAPLPAQMQPWIADRLAAITVEGASVWQRPDR